MTAAEKGRHCESCEKEVIDFTNMSDQEILNLLANTSGNLCGRFHASQLGRPVFLQKKEPFSNQWAKIGLLAASILMVVPAVGQEKPTKSDPVEQEISVQAKYWDLSGNVVNEEGESLAGASILLHGRSTGTVSDLDGKFVVPLHYSDKRMWVSYIGYRTQKILLEDKSLRNLTIVLQKGVKLQEIVVRASKIEEVPNEGTVGRLETMGELVLVKTTRIKSKRLKKRNLTVDPKIKVYPNPFTAHIQIEVGQLIEGRYHLNLISSSGQQLYNSTLLLHPHESLQVDLTSLYLPAGVYWLMLSDGKRQHFQQKLIKAH